MGRDPTMHDRCIGEGARESKRLTSTVSKEERVQQGSPSTMSINCHGDEGHHRVGEVADDHLAHVDYIRFLVFPVGSG